MMMYLNVLSNLIITISVAGFMVMLQEPSNPVAIIWVLEAVPREVEPQCSQSGCTASLFRLAAVLKAPVHTFT